VRRFRRFREVGQRRKAAEQARGAQEAVDAGPVADDAEPPAALPRPRLGAAQYAQARAVEEGDPAQIDQHVRLGLSRRGRQMLGQRVRRRDVDLSRHLDHGERTARITVGVRVGRGKP
jgi:hypothetical protein